MSAYILFQYNIWPGAVPDSASYLVATGSSECFSVHFPAHSATCVYNGYPDGLRIPFGYPQIWLVSAVHVLTGISILDSFRLVWGTFLVIALVAARQLFGLFTRIHWIAWAAAALYLIAPIVSNQGGYGPLQLGFALVPSYVLIDLWFLNTIDRRRHTVYAVAALMIVARMFALFTDGYSFTMAIIPTGLIYLFWGIRRLRVAGRRVATISAWGTAGLSVAIAYLSYTRFLGVSSFRPMSVDFFRGQGVDLYALAVPPRSLWFANITGLHHNVTATQAYSDGHNLSDVYLGWSLILVAAAGLILIIRKRALRSRVIVSLAAAGAVGFILALGPSLKIANFRPAQQLASGVPTVGQYMMRSGQASFSTGLSWIYQHVPAIDTMRALYRWELLVRLALLALAVVALTALAKRGRTAVAVIILLIMIGETVPSVPSIHRAGTRALTTVDQFNRDVVLPLVPLVRPEERTLLVNPAPGGSGSNHYLANSMCPQLRLRCFNTGGDKSAELAADGYSNQVRAVLASPKNLARNIDELFATDQVDVVIFVDFDLRANAYSWPASSKSRSAAQAAGREVLAGRHFATTTLAWTTIVRPP